MNEQQLNKDFFVNLFDFAGILSKEHENNFFDRIEENPYFLKNKMILDAGVGYGRVANILAKYGKKVVCVDYSNKILKIAKNNLKNHKNIRFIQANLLKLPFEDNTFDFVHCSGVLHHIKNHNIAFQQLCRVVKPDGMLFIGVVGDYGILHKTMKLIRPLTTRLPQKLLVSVFRIIVPPSWMIRNLIKIINIKIPSPNEKERLINILVDYLNCPYYKWYTKDELISMFDGKFNECKFTQMEVFNRRGLNKWILGNGWLNIKAVKNFEKVFE